MGTEYGEYGYRDENVLRELYKNERKPMGEIADIFDVSVSTVYRWITNHGIDVHHHGSPERRFHNSYEINENTGCWEWENPTHEFGYGMIRVDGDNWNAHRYSYKLHNGNVPGDALICHTCHNPSCVNPDHLYAGDHKTNAQDMVDAGRHSQLTGFDSPTSNLTENEVIDIRNRYADGETIQTLSAEFDISAGTVSRIINDNAYAEVGGPTDTDTSERMAKRGENQPNSKLNAEQVKQIRRKYTDTDTTMADLADKFDISTTTVSDIVNNKIWTHVDS